MRILFLGLFFLLHLYSAQGQDAQKTFLFVGSYTEGQPDSGIYVYQFLKNGHLRPFQVVAPITNPSYLSLDAEGKYLYACTETKLPQEGSLTAFRFDTTNGLQCIGKVNAGGENPVYLSLQPQGQYLVNVNYTGGSISLHRIDEKGALSPILQKIELEGSGPRQARQDKAHPHAAVFAPEGDFLFVPDLGADLIRVFRFDSLSPNPLLACDSLTVKTAPGSGPRHFSFHPNGKFAYCIEELGGTVSVYAYKAGKLEFLQRIFAYSQTQEIYNSADIHLSPDGKFLYASNRFEVENSIAIFKVDAQHGQLTLVGHQSTLGEHPRNFCLSKDGRFLIVANQVSGNIIVFKRNPKTGLLKKRDQQSKITNPSCVKLHYY